MTSSISWDIRSIPKQEPFSGKEEDWAEWVFTFKSYAYCLGMSHGLREVETLTEYPDLVDMSNYMERQSELLYHVLVQLLRTEDRHEMR